MRTSLTSLAAVATLLLAACGGGGSGSGTSTPSSIPTPPTSAPLGRASQSVSFRIPAPASSQATTPSSTARKTMSLSSRAPLYVSPDTARFSLYFDGQALFSNAAANTPGSGTATTPGNGTATYTITHQGVSPNDFFTVTASLDVLPGSHTIGVVLLATDGFVLSEDQETETLNGGTNAPATFFLRGVVDSAFWCDLACDGHEGTADATGTYHLKVFATDHAGDAIAFQTNGPTPILLDNGPVTLVETDSANIVSITPSGPFDNPGNAFTVSYTEAGVAIQEGYDVGVKCVNVGTTTVAMQVAGNSLGGGVTGFTYTSSTYTTPGKQVGPVPLFPSFGNKLQVHCDASQDLTFQ